MGMGLVAYRSVDYNSCWTNCTLELSVRSSGDHSISADDNLSSSCSFFLSVTAAATSWKREGAWWKVTACNCGNNHSSFALNALKNCILKGDSEHVICRSCRSGMRRKEGSHLGKSLPLKERARCRRGAEDRARNSSNIGASAWANWANWRL